ncbi:hypothetical protein [Bradyrhizobium sp. RD5-C2]|uniref:hypothetical protein n=1 Tax=Bradyrhizobium sp. RD5-C2 TaxID=244562 RepID=UPI001CC50C02|nr:hypothetical protein [Bradyrhizobium sp. RD5-C2]
MSKAVTVDTNLLLLLIVGLTNADYISKHKRLVDYSRQDFLLLTETLDRSGKIILTPNTITETSNWIDHIRDPARSEIRQVFNVFIANQSEVYVPSANAISRKEHVELGVADNVLLEIAKRALLISSDRDLCIAAAISDYSYLSFDFLRQESQKEL